MMPLHALLHPIAARRQREVVDAIEGEFIAAGEAVRAEERQALEREVAHAIVQCARRHPVETAFVLLTVLAIASRR